MDTQRYDDLITRSLSFFAELADNNTKAFFEPKKEFYNKEIKRPAEDMVEDIAQILSAKAQHPYRSKLFRVYRDVRFSKDKTPYNTHLHLMWRPQDEARPAWFFGASSEYVVIGMGLMGLDAAQLDRFRKFVDAQGSNLKQDIARASASISDWGPPPLKRVPKPYDQDHPHGDLLKRKALALSCDIGPEWAQNGIITEISTKIDALLPAYSRLSSVL